MTHIKISRPSTQELEEMGVLRWDIWEKEESEFPWHYDTNEHCYILEGRAEVNPSGGEPVEFGAGDYVVFPEGMDCTWKITEKIRKHYKFG